MFSNNYLYRRLYYVDRNHHFFFFFFYIKTEINNVMKRNEGISRVLNHVHATKIFTLEIIILFFEFQSSDLV